MMHITYDYNDNYYNVPVNSNIDYNCNLVKSFGKNKIRTHEKNNYIEKKNLGLHRKRINSIVSRKMKRNRQNKQDIFNN